jgi:hypothetical protein
MSLIGAPDGPLFRAGISVFDVMTGLHPVIGILSALHHCDPPARAARGDQPRTRACAPTSHWPSATPSSSSWPARTANPYVRHTDRPARAVRRPGSTPSASATTTAGSGPACRASTDAGRLHRWPRAGSWACRTNCSAAWSSWCYLPAAPRDRGGAEARASRFVPHPLTPRRGRSARRLAIWSPCVRRSVAGWAPVLNRSADTGGAGTGEAATVQPDVDAGALLAHLQSQVTCAARLPPTGTVNSARYARKVAHISIGSPFSGTAGSGLLIRLITARSRCRLW